MIQSSARISITILRKHNSALTVVGFKGILRGYNSAKFLHHSENMSTPFVPFTVDPFPAETYVQKSKQEVTEVISLIIKIGAKSMKCNLSSFGAKRHLSSTFFFVSFHFLSFFLFFYKLSLGKIFICKVERLTFKQRRSR